MKPRRGRKRTPKKSIHEAAEQKKVYCICRTTDSESFMICCDSCEDWFHGDCINITPKEADSILKFYCQACRDAKPDLSIVYKEGHNPRQSHGGRNRTAEMSSPVSGIEDYVDRVSGAPPPKRNRKHSQTMQSKSRRVTSVMPTPLGDSSEDEFDPSRSQMASPSSSYSHSHTGAYSSRSKYDRTTPSYDAPNEPEFSQYRRQLSRNRLSPPCGACESCKVRGNCGSCDVCRNPKFKQGRSRQYCLTKAKMCLSNNPDYQQPPPPPHMRYSVPRGRYAPPCGECESCRTKSNCGTCETCRNPKFRQGRNRPFCLYKAKNCLANDFQRVPPKVNSRSSLDLDYESHFDDFAPPPARYMPGSRKPAIGSKMRRGDHLPGGRLGNETGQFGRRRGGMQSDFNFLDSPDYQDNSYGPPPPHHSGRNGASSRFGGRHGGGIVDADDILGPPDSVPHYDSDEDVVLPGMRPCAGPACSKPAIRSKFCSEECQLRHESENISRLHTSSRYSNLKDQIPVPYALPYFDHLYCRHHRMHNSQVGGPADAHLGVQQQGGPVPPDLYTDAFGNLVGSSPSAQMDYVCDPAQMQTTYRRLPASHGAVGPDEFFTLPPQSGKINSAGGGFSRKLFDGRGASTSSLSGRRQVHSTSSLGPGGSEPEVLSPPVPLESITPTMHSLRLFNGHLPDYRINTPEGEGVAAAAELLTAENNDLVNVHCTSAPSVVGGGDSGGINAGSSTNTPAFRQGDEYYMMNENENIEINWPTSPGGVATASAGTV